MRRLITAIAAVMMFISGATAYAGEFGPAEPTAKPGGFALGIGYTHHQAKLKTNVWSDKLTQNEVYMHAEYSPARNMAVYAKLGGADMKIKNVYQINLNDYDFKDGMKPFAALGVKGMVDITNSFGVGLFAQGAIYGKYKDVATDTSMGTVDQIKSEHKNTWAVDIGIPVQYKFAGSDILLYGGPVVYWYKTKNVAESFTNGVSDGPPISGYIKEKNNIGGFVGARIPISKGINLVVEVQMKSMFSLGSMVSFAF
ncbi:MAG: hypothetical protein JXR79_09185 [Nitrospirae bacterium]|nr:hypothetical protein [Nitrospirota bacterium]